MKPKIIIAFVAITIVFGLAGCKPKEITLTGQAFIVTRGAENIKLGLIEVKLIQKQDVKKHLERLLPAVESELSSRQQDLENSKREKQKNLANLASFDSSGPLTTVEYKKMITDYSTLTNKIDQFSDQYAELQKRKQNLAIDIDATNHSVLNIRESLGIMKASYNRDFLAAYKATLSLGSAATQADIDYYSSIAKQRGESAAFGQSQIDKWTVELNRLSEIAKTKQLELDSIEESLREFKIRLSDLSRMAQESRSKLELFEKSAALQRIELERQCSEADSRQKQAEMNLASCPSAEIYFSTFTLPTVQKTVTDADGKFSISYSRSSALTIFAKAERVVGTKIEKYFWLVNAPTNSETAQIFLSNQNLVYVDPDGYFKIKPVEVSQ